jgi:hypothetical protein
LNPPSRFGEAASAYEPEDPDVDEPVEELDVLVFVEEDVDLLSEVEDVSEEAAGLAPSPAGFLA